MRDMLSSFGINTLWKSTASGAPHHTGGLSDAPDMNIETISMLEGMLRRQDLSPCMEPLEVSLHALHCACQEDTGDD